MMCSFIIFKRNAKVFYTDHSLCFPAPSNLMAKNRVSIDKTKKQGTQVRQCKDCTVLGLILVFRVNLTFWVDLSYR